MMPQVIAAAAVAPQPWRNGGGRTRELLAWPSPVDPLLRISLADIDADGPFSAYSGVRRWFAVVEGAGVELRFADGTRRIGPDDEPLSFDGAAAPYCRLLDGRTRDLNLMHRDGRAAMRRVIAGADWRPEGAQCGLYTAVPGTWSCRGGPELPLPARTLLWWRQAPAAAMRFHFAGAATAGAGWWLSYSGAEPTR